MRLQPSDTMAATAVLNTGGNLGGLVATPIIAALSAGQNWRLVFATGAVTSIVAALLWLFIDAGRGRG
jgi:sugar phosphate permease